MESLACGNTETRLNTNQPIKLENHKHANVAENFHRRKPLSARKMQHIPRQWQQSQYRGTVNVCSATDGNNIKKSGDDLGTNRGRSHHIMLAHALENPTDRSVRLFGGNAELIELAAVGIGDILRQRNQRTNHGGSFDHRLESFLNGLPRNHAIAGAIVAHVRKIVQQERVANRGRRQRDDILTLLLLEAKDQIGLVGHLTGQPSGTESAWFNADALHKTATRRIDRMHRQATGAGARHSDGGASQVVRHQQLAHRGTADVARANEHDMHIYPLEFHSGQPTPRRKPSRRRLTERYFTATHDHTAQ